MFLSMLVAWMIPDVPRSLREQLKKENMALMEFLLDHDKEACAKTHSPKRPVPCFPANVDIVVDVASEEDDMCQVENEEEDVNVEINLDEPTGSNESNAEGGKLLGVEDESQEEQKDEVSEGKGNEHEDVKEEYDKRSNEEEKEEQEGQTHGGENEDDENTAEETATVDLDAFMRKLGLWGKMKTFITT